MDLTESADEVVHVPVDLTESAVVPPPPPHEAARTRARLKTPPSLKYIVSVPDKTKLTKMSLDRYNAYYHEILHLGGCGNCEICNVAKQRRHKQTAVKPEDTYRATKMYEKTMFDTVESGRDNLCKGVNGFTYGTAVKDEASEFAHFGANRKKDHSNRGSY